MLRNARRGESNFMGQITCISPTFADMQHTKESFFSQGSAVLRWSLAWAILWGGGLSAHAQWVGLTYAVDTAFYAPMPLPGATPDTPEAAFDSEGLLAGNTAYWIYAHFSSPLDRLQAVYALNSGNSLSPPWQVEAECGCYEHPFGSSVWNTTTWPFSPLFPELAYDSYLTMDHHPGSSIAGTVPLINGPSNLPAICNIDFEDVAMYVLGGVAAGEDLRIPIAHITTCGPVDFQACFQVSQALAGGQVQNICSSVAMGGPLHIDPPCADYATMTTEVFVDALASGTPVTFEDGGAGADPLQISLFDVSAGTWLDGVIGGPVAAGIPPGTYYAAIVDAETCRDTTEVFCVPPPFEFCGGGCINDGDGDGICDEVEIPGCGDVEACNFAPDYTDLVPCVYPEPGYDCDGECLADGDGDGFCDPFEVGGCMAPFACNFDPAATDDDGSCTFLETGEIAGPAASTVGATESYGYGAAPGHAVAWSVPEGGTLLTAPESGAAEVLWTAAGVWTVWVVESNDTCASAPVGMPVEVDAASGLVQGGAMSEQVEWRWGAGGSEILVEVPAAWGRWNWELCDTTGRRWAGGEGGYNCPSTSCALPVTKRTGGLVILRVWSESGVRWAQLIPPFIP